MTDWRDIATAPRFSVDAYALWSEALTDEDTQAVTRWLAGDFAIRPPTAIKRAVTVWPPLPPEE